MPIHDDVLRAAQRLCRERGERTFSAEDVVRALPHLNENSVRAHISSRCCVNAPPNHPHRWPYFRRVARGPYEIRMARHGAEAWAARGSRRPSRTAWVRLRGRVDPRESRQAAARSPGRDTADAHRPTAPAARAGNPARHLSAGMQVCAPSRAAAVLLRTNVTAPKTSY